MERRGGYPSEIKKGRQIVQLWDEEKEGVSNWYRGRGRAVVYLRCGLWKWGEGRLRMDGAQWGLFNREMEGIWPSDSGIEAMGDNQLWNWVDWRLSNWEMEGWWLSKCEMRDMELSKWEWEGNRDHVIVRWCGGLFFNCKMKVGGEFSFGKERRMYC